MRITTLMLRNYRVFRELDIEFPAGLVGVYGANGAGKSSLLESIMWALYGRARTGKGEIRTSGESGECVVELGFEHEENYYLVRRSLSGKNATVKARVTIGEAVVADGITDTSKYLQSVLGLDELAFRSSVFAEQKQLAAFSDQSPDQRRKLVLQLLGITPIEKARDNARADYRQRQKEHTTLQAILGTLTASEERVAWSESEAAKAEQVLLVAERSFEVADAKLTEAQNAFRIVESAAKESERIKSLGGAARKRRDDLVQNHERALVELSEAEVAAEQLAAVPAASEKDLDTLQVRLDQLLGWQRAVTQLEALPPVVALEEPSDEPVQTAQRERHIAATDHASLAALANAAKVRWQQAKVVSDRHDKLTATDDCPMCGQELGKGFTDVREHALREVADAHRELDSLTKRAVGAEAAFDAATTALAKAERAYETDRTAYQRALQTSQRRTDARSAVEQAERLAGSNASLTDLDSLRAQIAELHEHRTLAARLRERAERRIPLRLRLQELATQLEGADAERSALLSELKALNFDAPAFRLHEEQRATAQQEEAAQRRALDAARVAHARASQQAHDAALALTEAAEKQQALQDLELEARYMGRTADLLGGFRQAIVSTVGPQLSTHASALFNELTAGEYDGLHIDGETYAIQVIDGGVPYSSERFSGSEVDLANLALRVAISEQIRFQAGGQVGLLVLDEALASLDTDRKDRMLGALTRLGGRFRQILVVTHSPDVKERLPQAIEVRRTSGRGSTARVIDQAPM
jgi:DNA repair exonuclease SbcCD ATPase subunit